MHLVMALPVRVAVVCGVMVTITSPWSHPGEEFVLLEALLERTDGHAVACKGCWAQSSRILMP